MKQLNKLALTIQFATTPANLPSRAEFRHWAKAALLHDVEATLRVVDEAEGMQLNQDYRDKPAATNVLTFAYGAEQDDGPLTGDIVLCAAVVEREAVEQDKTLTAHYAHLTVHGMLHLQGYDHEVENEAIAMEAIEGFIMMRLGFPDPYQDG
ncbi:MAG: rRNA maturation RNase YbeY [Gallionellaceae bacterium]|nr:rRNA maturation RNase YbeY [Gallionellaceae bacterium]